MQQSNEKRMQYHMMSLTGVEQQRVLHNTDAIWHKFVTTYHKHIRQCLLNSTQSDVVEYLGTRIARDFPQWMR
jgi:hypothetical protein